MRAKQHKTAPAPSSVTALIVVVAAAAGVTFGVTAGGAWQAVLHHPAAVAVFVGVTLALQLGAVEIYARGAVSFASAGLLAIACMLGPGVAVAAAVAAAALNFLRRGGRLERAVFDAANLGLASVAGWAVFAMTDAHALPIFARIGPAIGAAAAFLVVNVGLLCAAMGLSEGISPRTVWAERFRWMTLYYLVAGPLAVALSVAYEKLGLVGLLAFALPPAFMMISIHQYLARTKTAVEDLRSANEELRDRAETIRRTHLATIGALARSMEAKDFYTGGHTERVALIAVALARKLGYVGDDLEAVETGALLHDIGKIGIPERILHKPGPLDEAEWKTMREHPVISEYILSEVELHPFVTQIARSSHERVDGQGYPDGLSGEAIPLPARVVLVADAIDALTSDRPYRRARSLEHALEEMRQHAGTQFCPQVIAALEQLIVEQPELLAGPQLYALPGPGTASVERRVAAAGGT